MNTYEGMFILAESIDGDAVEPAIKRLHASIQEQGGNVISTTRLGKRVFARIMQKKASGQYLVIGFSLDGGKIDSLKARLKLNEECFRTQFIRAEPTEAPVEKKEEAEATHG